jgi:hypothetical protein
MIITPAIATASVKSSCSPTGLSPKRHRDQPGQATDIRLPLFI